MAELPRLVSNTVPSPEDFSFEVQPAPSGARVLALRRASDAVQEFRSEEDAPVALSQGQEEPADVPRRSVGGKWRRPALVAAFAAAAVALVLAATGWPRIQSARTARVVIESSPRGASVWVGGTARGVTPLELNLPTGPARIVVRSDGDERVLDLQLRAGEVVRQLIEMRPPSAVAAPQTGTLEVTSDQPRVPLLLDGIPAGTTPLNPTTLSAGDHVLTARFRGGAVEQRVQVLAGRTTSLHLVSRTEIAGAVAGWLNVQSPIPLRIFEVDQLLGTTDVDRVMLPVGIHTLRFVSEETGFEVTQEVNVGAGRPSLVAITVPTAPLSINARPWAEVFIDGERVGETPLGNLQRPLGRHEIVLRHPDFGERRQVAVVSLKGPTRVSVDFQSR